MKSINLTVGTAGHIDHGKTALVKNLTGCDTDRLKEEKERGMSIELGFAPCMIADTQIGVVDVPGHENFIKKMVAGAVGMDAVILVIAADDGVMPQTREHLDILSLLGIRHGLVVITKIDRIEPTKHAEVVAKARSFLQGTFLESSPIFPLSNVTGEGFDPFLESLAELTRSILPKRIDGIFRAPIERVFTAPGYGTVVAGIPVSGMARVGDEVVLLPQNLSGRIRRIEVYGQDSGEVLAGQCAAINVGRWDHRDIRRGDVLTLPGYFTPKEWFVCSLKLLPHEKLRLKSGCEVKFHVGTSETAAFFYPLSGAFMDGGAEALVQIRTKSPVVAGPGDHFLLRTPTPTQTVGGGQIVEAVDRRYKGNRPGVSEDLHARRKAICDERSFVEYCVRKTESFAIDAPTVAVRVKMHTDRTSGILADLVSAKKIFSAAGNLFVHEETAADLAAKIVSHIEESHRQAPESPGVAHDQLRRLTTLEKPIFDAVISRLMESGRVVERFRRLALPSHHGALQNDDAQTLDAIDALYRAKLFAPPSIEEIAAQLSASASTVEKRLRVLCEHERLVRTENGILFHQEAISKAQEIVAAHFQEKGRLESVDFKYLLDTTRKFALPLLDYLDRIGVTRRVGNTRYPKK